MQANPPRAWSGTPVCGLLPLPHYHTNSSPSEFSLLDSGIALPMQACGNGKVGASAPATKACSSQLSYHLSPALHLVITSSTYELLQQEVLDSEPDLLSLHIDRPP
jgi:hypothetical protein